MDNGASSYRRFLDGDDAGMAEIVGAYKDGLILYLNGYVRNLHTAEELTEDTFFRLMVKRPRFSGKSSFKSWLYAIARHVALDHLRRHARLVLTPEPVEEQRQLESLETAYIRDEGKIMLHRALTQLTPEYRQVLYLVYFQGFSGQEAALALGKSDRQIRNLLYRAKQSLKAKLEQEGFTYEEL